MLLLLQILVLILTAFLWWSARRDLTAKTSEKSGAEREELEELRRGVEEISANLETRAAAAMAQMTDAEARIKIASNAPKDVKNIDENEDQKTSVKDFDLNAPDAVKTDADIYAPVRELADSGLTDAAEIARRTGLGRGEVELVLGLRGRR